MADPNPTGDWTDPKWLSDQLMGAVARACRAERRFEELERELSDCKADLDCEVTEGERLRVSDADIRELCGPADDDGPTLELVRSRMSAHTPATEN